ncbi:hypothetical protein [Bacteroides caecigallinarum]|uniref:hypothetical protein n=1 Tax=Bacteroides caecigallinarum TaxID=1411144 RepID=UPI001F349279|nr:hypothetical protein [Bacteroides caecigallinarum]MCF2738864.1 hypothetical protein [Bacteroides caecigallinarum]
MNSDGTKVDTYFRLVMGAVLMIGDIPAKVISKNIKWKGKINFLKLPTEQDRISINNM